MLAANEAAGGINDSEKSAANAIYSITASGYTVDDFTAAVASTTTCDVAQTYSNGTIPLISSISSDGDYVVCAKLTDAAGNISYGKSATVTRDVLAPSFTEMLAANEAAGGINDSEKTAANAIYSITASGYSTDDFTAAIASTTTCDVAQTILTLIFL